ncbi:MAG: DUF2845 domain-containing protein [Syntrophobacteraceae bacterium]
MKKPSPAALTAVCLALCAVCAFTLAGHCSGDCARIGDTMSQVLRYCGEPSWADSWDEGRAVPYIAGYDGWYIRDRRIVMRQAVVEIQEWTYNYGPTHFVRILRFENGILAAMGTGGYGR